MEPEVLDYVAECEKRGETCILAARDGTVIGTLAIGDTLRAESRQAVEAIQKLGCRVVLLTGDSWSVANAVAERLGVDEAFGEMPPEQKLEKIRALEAQGREDKVVR